MRVPRRLIPPVAFGGVVAQSSSLQVWLVQMTPYRCSTVKEVIGVSDVMVS